MRILATAACCAALLAGCATYAPPQQPQALNIAPGVWSLSIVSGGLPRSQVGVLRRAADLTLAEGGDWFRVLDRMHGADGDSYGFGSGNSDAYDMLSDPGPAMVATVEVEIGRGTRPPGHDVYDARAVVAYTGGYRGSRRAPAVPPGAAAI